MERKAPARSISSRSTSLLMSTRIEPNYNSCEFIMKAQGSGPRAVLVPGIHEGSRLVVGHEAPMSFGWRGERLGRRVYRRHGGKRQKKTYCPELADIKKIKRRRPANRAILSSLPYMYLRSTTYLYCTLINPQFSFNRKCCINNHNFSLAENSFSFDDSGLCLCNLTQEAVAGVRERNLEWYIQENSSSDRRPRN